MTVAVAPGEEISVDPELQFEEGQRGNVRLVRLWWEILERFEPTIFCEIGAYDGYMAFITRRRFPGVRAFAFEANPEIFAAHAEAAEMTHITYRNLAICERAGLVRIYSPRTLSEYDADGVVRGHVPETDSTGKSSLLLRREEAAYAEFEVPGTSLDAFFAEEVVSLAGERLALWIDVEGAADRVLRGARATLAHTGAIFLETENFPFWQGQQDSRAITRELVRLGFVPLARDREYGDRQFNIVFVKNSLRAELLDYKSLKNSGGEWDWNTGWGNSVRKL
jgi:FkbM family methyltransferase